MNREGNGFWRSIFMGLLITLIIGSFAWTTIAAVGLNSALVNSDKENKDEHDILKARDDILGKELAGELRKIDSRLARIEEQVKK